MLGNWIKAERERRGWTLADLAAASHISAGYLEHLEGNRRPNPGARTLAKLADAFGVSVDEIITQAGLHPAERPGPALARPDPAGLDSLPAPFRRAVLRAKGRFTEDQWRMATNFLAFLASVGPQPDQAYGHQTPDEHQNTEAEDGPGAG